MAEEREDGSFVEADRGPPEQGRKFDAILCRNVLIYFGDQTTTRVVRQLTAALKVGGLLLVGTSLEREEHSGSFFYRKSA